MTKKEYLKALNTLGSVDGEKMTQDQLKALNDVMTYIEALKDYNNPLFYALFQKNINLATLKMRSNSVKDWATLFTSIFVNDIALMYEVGMAFESAKKILKENQKA